MSNHHDVRARFSVLAEADPGLLPRLVQPLARRDLIPDSLRATRDGDAMRIDLQVTMPAEMVHLVAGNLGQIVGVRSLLTDQEPAREAA